MKLISRLVMTLKKQLLLLILDSLEDFNIVRLSHEITSEQEVRDLGTNVFKLDENIIDDALFDHRTSIQELPVKPQALTEGTDVEKIQQSSPMKGSYYF